MVSTGFLASVQNYLSEQPKLSLALTLVGGLVVAKFILKTLLVFAEIFVLPGTSLKKYGAKKGAWAVVTGASDGIGKEFSLQLAEQGFNIVLVARNAAKLNEVKDEILNNKRSSAQVDVKVHVIDFSTDDLTEYSKLGAAVQNLDVGILVNNVGRSHAMPVDFIDLDAEEMEGILKVNINANLRVTKSVLPTLLKRKNGLIINVGSFSGSTPCAMLQTYSASKQFLSSWSDALAQELKPKGIDVQLLNTYFVVSKLSKIRRPSLFIPTPRPYVKSVLSKLGVPAGAKWTGRPSTTTPYWSHAIMDWAMNNVLRSKPLEMAFNLSTQKDFRRRALRKQERERKGI